MYNLWCRMSTLVTPITNLYGMCSMLPPSRDYKGASPDHISRVGSPLECGGSAPLGMRWRRLAWRHLQQPGGHDAAIQTV